MKTLLLLNLGASDDWLRAQIRGVPYTPCPVLQGVVCEDSHEADRIFRTWTNRHVSRRAPCGGAMQVRYDGPETIQREKARWA